MSEEEGEAAALPQAGLGAATETTPLPSPPKPTKSLFAYFGTGAGPSTAPSSSTTPAVVPRKRRKKGEDPGQARFIPQTQGEGSGWAIGKKPEKDEPKKGVKRGRKGAEGEEAEMKEMSKRAAGGIEVKKRGRKGKNGGPATGTADTGEDAFGLSEQYGEGSQSNLQSVATGPKPSPAKRKRGRPRKNDPGVPTSRTASRASTVRSRLSQGSPPTINLLSSDPPDPADDDRPILTGMKLDRLSGTHPVFSRANSTTSKGASQQDPIDIEDHPVMEVKKAGPRKLVFAADQKAAHSFFGKPLAAPEASGSRSSSVAPAPEVVAGKRGPEKQKSKEGKVHAFFQPGNQVPPGKLRDGWGGAVKTGEEWLAPLPGRVWPSHIDCPLQTAGPSVLPGKRRKISPAPCDDLSSFFSRVPQEFDIVRPVSTPKATTRTYSTIDHPSIRSVPCRSRSSNRETWCERYRPLKASQVLGNEVEADYLRDWLKLLSVGVGQDGGRSARVTRRIPRRKTHLTDGWIVDDLGLFDDDLSSDVDEEFEPIEELPSPFGPRSSVYPDLDTRLANTMLITGPHGSGKSAAVYAVAEELGWEIFEVYPGIGRRTGANLVSLVGDVGSNHVITSKSPKKPRPTTSFFGKPNGTTNANGTDRKRANKLPVLSSSQGSQGDPIQLDDRGWEEPEILEDKKNGFRQSVTLLDEVDLLFEEESTFWPAVIALIADSRRPVILTCNDPLKVPILSLPLQTILRFQPSSPDLAIPYLQAIATNERLSDLDPAELYRDAFSSPPDILNDPHPLPPSGHEPVQTFDLRKAITQMQLDRGRVHMRRPSPTAETSELQRLVSSLEQRSFSDAWIESRAWAKLEITEIDRYHSGSDDLLGEDLLCKPSTHPDRPALAANTQNQNMADYMLSLASPIVPASTDQLKQDQITYNRALLPLLDPIIPISSYLLPHPSIYTDYVPVLRSIVEADDIMQIAEEESLVRGGDRLNRKTGRPMRSVMGWLSGSEFGSGYSYARYLRVGKEGEEVVRKYKLGQGD